MDNLTIFLKYYFSQKMDLLKINAHFCPIFTKFFLSLFKKKAILAKFGWFSQEMC